MKKLAVLLFVFLNVNTFAQDFNFGKISKEELQEAFNPLDSSANATFLYKYRKTFFEYRQGDGFELITEVHERVKIYNQEGFAYATKELRLGKSGSDREQFSNLKAYTYNLVNGKIEEDKIGKEGVFDSELHKYANQVKFTMPNIKPGCIVEYKYRITSPFVTNVDDYVFQHNIPIKRLEAVFETPEYFNFKTNTKGFFPVIPKKEKVSDRLVPTQHDGDGTSLNSSNSTYTKEISTYNLSNIPALKLEPYVNNIDNYRSTVKYELSYVNFPQTPIKYYSTTWEDVVKTIYESPNFGDELKKTGYFENDIDAIIGSISDPVKRISLIFDFVKSNIKWNDYYGYSTNDGVKKAYKDHVGNVAEINLMLTAMLRYAGLNAYPVLVSTRQNGIPLFPTRDGYNYVVSCVKLPNAVFLLDGTNRNSAPNVLPIRALNWQGRIVSEHGGSEPIDLYPAIDSKNSIMGMLNLDEKGTLTGALRSTKTNHNAWSYREEFNGIKKEDFLTQLENKNKGLEISDFEVQHETDYSEPILESYKFEMESQADIINNKIYFSPLFFLKTNENPFKLEKREYPVDFGYASSTTYRLAINIPAGYQVESLPEGGSFVMPDNLASFKYNVTANAASVQLFVSTEMHQPIIPYNYYEALKAYFSKIVEKEAEQIVLTKI